jgi:hypothetical protein
MGMGCVGRREWERQNREWWQNMEWQATLAALISSRDLHVCIPINVYLVD